MSLPDVAALKRYLRIEITAEDTLLAELLASALALSQRRIGCPITAISLVQIDPADTEVFYSNGVLKLIVPVVPIGTVTAITDNDGTALDLTLLVVDGRTGIIRYKDNVSRFTNGPYTITAPVGLSALAEYADTIEPLVSGAIRDFVADLYQRRSPGAWAESAAGGVRRDWTHDGIPARVADVLDTLRGSAW